MASVPEQHRAHAPAVVRCAVLTVSDTRTLDRDDSGRLAVELLERAGYEAVERARVPDDPQQIRHRIGEWVHGARVDVVLVTGGTGIARRDRTPETVQAMFEKTLDGFGELFRMLSYQDEKVRASAMLSRAVAGTLGQTVIFVMPGSKEAVRLAMEKLILPELGHIVGLLRKG